MSSSPCHHWAPASGAVLCSLPFPVCPCSSPIPAAAALLVASQRGSGPFCRALDPARGWLPGHCASSWNEGFISSQVYQKQPWVVC